MLDNASTSSRRGRAVAFLVSTTADLRILTTAARRWRWPRHVYVLGELGLPEPAQLFRERALDARADVRLDAAVARRIVERLDGLPLAIELAAAKVRAMALEEIDRRLEDRFALLALATAALRTAIRRCSRDRLVIEPA